MHIISMGQGQEVHARKHVQASLANGNWVLLQNCHLSLEYVAELTDQLTELPANQVNDDFRLWITCEAHDKFPITFLQVCTPTLYCTVL